MNVKTSPIACKINNVFIHVSDLKTSVKWYADLLGLSIDESTVESPVHNIPITGETGLTLDDHTFDPGFTLAPSSHVLFNFYVEDIDEAYQFTQANNIQVTREIERIGEFAYFNFQDPDGNVLMICNG
ncbi:putative enzyme related to lactoylglutathione lyase [Sporosarcina luteola]|nr:putative enzyme related to lactoylglutathione lyase [Sporosarcina luteola]